MKRAAELGLIVAVHAESEEITQQLKRERIAAGKTTVSDYLSSRPVRAELDAISRAIDLAAETGCRLHIVHVSCGRGVELVAKPRARGVDVSCETCPHYLLLTDEDMGRLGAVAKCAPPLRAAEEQQDLWARLGDVTTIGSDHSPSPWAMKERANFFEVWGGISGCQHLLPLLLDAVREKKAFSHSEIAKWTSAAVAKRFGISQKGGVEVGKDADFTLVDLRAEETITTESLLYRHRHSPYVGRRPSAKVVRTILRGQTIFQNGKIAARPMGRFLRPNEYV